MHISQLKQSNYLTKTDVGKGMLVTIRDLTQENLAKQGAPEELKHVLHFEETDKPMVLNPTNGTIIAGFLGSEDTDDWMGKKIVLFEDKTISFGGRLVGGIRARAPRNVAPPAPAPARRPPPAGLVSAPAPRPAVQPQPEYVDPATALPEDDECPF